MRFLVTLDGSHLSEAILGTVQKLAEPLGAEIELLGVGEPHRQQVAAIAPGSGEAETREQALVRLETDLRTYLEERAREMPRVKSRISVDIADDPAAVIIARARERHVDLIAMATHGRSGVNHMLMGSVCERVVRSGVAPVLVLRP